MLESVVFFKKVSQMKMEVVLKVVVLGLSVLIIDEAAAQSNLKYGGFDSQAASVPQYCYDAACPSGNWLIYTGAGFVRQGNTNWPAPSPESVPMLVFLQSNSARVEQSFSVAQTGSYIVRFSLASRNDHGGAAGAQTVSLELNNQQIFLKTLQSNQPFQRFVSGQVTLSAGTTYNVRFSGLGSGDVTAFLDSVSIVLAGGSTSYTYDAKGRIVRVNQSSGINSGVDARYSYDKANNRTNVTVSVP